MNPLARRFPVSRRVAHFLAACALVGHLAARGVREYLVARDEPWGPS